MKLNNFSKQGLLLVVLLLGALQPAAILAAHSSEELILPPVAQAATASQANPNTVTMKLPKVPAPCCNHERCAMINAETNANAMQAVQGVYAMRVQNAHVVNQYHRDTRKYLIRGGLLFGVFALSLATMIAGSTIALVGHSLKGELNPYRGGPEDDGGRRDPVQDHRRNDLFVTVGRSFAVGGLLSTLGFFIPNCLPNGLIAGLIRKYRRPVKLVFASGCYEILDLDEFNLKNQKRCQAVLKIRPPDSFALQHVEGVATVDGYRTMVIKFDRFSGTIKTRLVG